MPRKQPPILRIVAPLVGAALVLSGCSGGGSGTSGTSAAAGDSTLRVNYDGFPENWTPGQEMEGGLMRVPYETLIGFADDGSLEPFLASDWELTDDALTLTLQEGVKFQDGTDFNAEAVKVNVETVRDGATANASALSHIESVDVVDDTTVKLNLTEPTPSLPTTLASRVLPIGSPAAIEDGSIAQTPVGTSPWMYDESLSVTGTKLHFSSFADYWGETPGFANIEIFAIEEDDSVLAALQNGELDLSEVSDQGVPAYEGTQFELLEYPAIRNNLIFFDRGEGGQFASQELRQAMCYAMNPQEMVDVRGSGGAATQHFAEGEQGYNPDLNAYETDLDKAKELYAEAGSPSVSATIPAAAYNEQQIKIYMEQASQIGNVSVSVETMPPPQFASSWASGQYPLGLASNDELTPYDWYSSWFAADAPGNPSGVESDELKAAADKAIAAGDSDEADALWADVTGIIADEALTCAFATGVESIAYNPATVSGVAAPSEPWEPQSINYRDLTPTA